MTMQVRAGFMLIAVLAMVLAGCDHYVCGSGPVLGGTCTASTTSLGSGTTGSATAAFAFAVDTAGTIDGYTLNTTAGTFTATTPYTAPTIPTNEGGVGMVVAQSKYLYAGFGVNGGELYGWTVSSTGTLTAISGLSPLTVPALAEYVAPVGQATMITNPAGTLLFISDTLRNQIVAYQIGSGGALTEVSGSPFTIPFEPMNLSTDGLGKYLYVINGDAANHTGSEIAAYSIGTTGALTVVPGSPFTYPMYLVKGEPTGQFLIGTSGKTASTYGSDDDHLYVFSITQSGANAGAISEVSDSPFATQFSPFSIAVQSNTGGNLVYSFSFNDTAPGFNGVEGYAISSAGALTAVTGSPFTNVAEGTWGQFDQSGAFLLVWSSVFDETNSTQVTQLGPDEVGTAGALTQPISTLTLASESFWVVTDPQ